MDARSKINKRRAQQAKRGGRAAGTTRGGRGGGRIAGRVGGRTTEIPRVRTGTVRAGKIGATAKAKSQVQRQGNSIKVTKSVKDLRQLIGGKPVATIKGPKQTAIKKRLGLQSRTAREAARSAFRSDNVGNASLRVTTSVGPRVTISNPNSRGGGARRIARRAIQTATTSIVSGQQSLSRSRVWRRTELDPQIVIPPPTVIIASQGYGGQGTGLDSLSNKGNSVVVSNLNSTITQADLLELFGDIGTISTYTMINPNTAMITYVSPHDAASAVKNYHNRLLDGLPMQCTLIPSPGAGGSGVAAASSRHVSQAFQQALRSSR